MRNNDKIPVLTTPAKINIVLRVLRKRNDGYHDIFSVMQPISLYDNISLEAGEGEGITIRCENPLVPPDKTNLAYRAAELLLKRAGLKRRVTIGIEKNIPVAAGLGGGSSDAAAVLMGLNDILKAGLGEKELMEEAGKLGSDVPFFILNSPAIARGRGTELERIKLPAYHYVLINPGFEVPTAWAYSNLHLTKRGEDNNLIYSEEVFAREADIGEFLANDLESAVLPGYPELSRIKKAFLGNGASGALMSGSGPTVFGIFTDGAKAAKAFNNLKSDLKKGFLIFLAKGL